jgi:5-methylcytosine-specific restriction protein A
VKMRASQAPRTLPRPGPARVLGEGVRRADGVVRSDEGAERSRLYRSAQWRRVRADHLDRSPWCVMCAEQGVQTRATVVDHVLGHSGNWRPRFFLGPFRSLCVRCHNRITARDTASPRSSWFGS